MESRLVKACLLGVLIVCLPWHSLSQSSGKDATAAQSEAEYVCLMHPDEKSKAEGTCSKCGMALKQPSRQGKSEVAPTSRWGPDYFPNVTLTTQDGKKVRFYDDLLKGKVVAITMIYTNCVDNCPLETARMLQMQKMLGDRVGKDIFFYSISIDPRRDTPEVLKSYAEKYKAGPGWLFLTGDEKDIELISRKLGLYSEPDPNDRDGHLPTLLLGNVPAGVWMRNSALDNPSFLTIKLNQVLGNYSDQRKGAVKSPSVAARLEFTKGQYLFATRCVACHTIGGGDHIGPDLAGVTRLRERRWLTRFIMTPEKMIEEKDPIAMALFKKYKEVRMPYLRLTQSDVASLIDYIEAQTVALRAKEYGGTTK